MDGTLTPWASVWILICWLTSFFLGALVAARLAGRIDDTTGMLHGLTVWAVATVVTVVLGYYGMSTVLQTGQNLMSVAAQATGATVSATASGIQSAAQGTATLTQQVVNQYGDRIQSRLYDRAAELAASSSGQVTEQEIRQAVNALDQRTLRRIVIDLSNDDSEGAAELVAENTRLSREDAEAIVDATYRELEQQFGNPNNDESLAEDVKRQLIEDVDAYLVSLDSRGGLNVTEEDIEQALNNLSAEEMQMVGMELISGDVDGAKRAIARSTNLSTAKIDELVDGAYEGIQEEIDAYQQAANETVETASTYASQVLWVIFAGAAAALAAAIGGGYLGAEYSQQLPRTSTGSRTSY
jgi:DNA-binding transcriptional regulator YdaS (Cro superfamily)